MVKQNLLGYSLEDKTIYAISDIHGCLNELNILLDEIKQDDSDYQLVFLGDYVDRGQKSKEVIEKVMELVDNGAIALKGNHDAMFVDFLLKNDLVADQVYLKNGGLTTIERYVGYDWFEGNITYDKLNEAKRFIIENHSKHVDFLSNLPYLLETGRYVFVHAGINPNLKNWRDTSEDEMIWIRDEFLSAKNLPGKITFIHGHTPCTFLNEDETHEVHFNSNRIGIDGAAAYGGQLNCLKISKNNYNVFSVKKGAKDITNNL